MLSQWFVYIMTNYKNTVFYTGVTNDVIKRVWQHRYQDPISSFCRRYRIYKLIWIQEFSDPDEAISAEKKVKDMRREKKLHLITQQNPNFLDLYAQR